MAATKNSAKPVHLLVLAGAHEPFSGAVFGQFAYRLPTE